MVLIVVVRKPLRRYTWAWKENVVVGVGRMSEEGGIINLQSVV